MDGFKHRVPLADIRAPCGTHAALNLSGFIGQNVAVEVRQGKDLELRTARRVEKLGGHDVYVPSLPSDFRILLAHRSSHIQEESVRGLDHVGFGDDGHAFLAHLLRVGEGCLNDSLRSRSGVHLEVHAQVLRHHQSLTPHCIEIFRVFPKKDPVNFCLRDSNRTHVGKKIQLLSHRHVRALNVGPGASLLRGLRRSLQRYMTLFDLSQNLVRDGLVLGRPIFYGESFDHAKINFSFLDRIAQQVFQDSLSLLGNVRTNSISSQDPNLNGAKLFKIQPILLVFEPFDPLQLLLQELSKMLFRYSYFFFSIHRSSFFFITHSINRLNDFRPQ